MNQLSELYPPDILEHDKSPRHTNEVENPTHRGRLSNPLCGDRVHAELVVEDQKMSDICCKVRGCALSRASASMMGDKLKGRSVSEILQLIQQFEAWIDQTEDVSSDPFGEDFRSLGQVRAFPSRKGCVTLPWLCLRKILQEDTPADPT